MPLNRLATPFLVALALLAGTLLLQAAVAQSHSDSSGTAPDEKLQAPAKKKRAKSKAAKRAAEAAPQDAKNIKLDNPPPTVDEKFDQFGIYEQSAPRPADAEPVATELPLVLSKGDRIALIGNTLFERSQEFGNLEALLQRAFAQQQLTVRHLAWSADEIDLQPRPANFADTEQHLTHEQADVIFAAFGFNESFAGDAGLAEFRRKLAAYLEKLKSKAYNGRTAPRIVLVSPIANENVAQVAAADLNNVRIEKYVAAMREVAREQQVGFVDVFQPTERALLSPGTDLTINGIHLTEAGDRVFAEALFRAAFGLEPPRSTTRFARPSSRRIGSSSAVSGRSTRSITPADATRTTATSIFSRRCATST